MVPNIFLKLVITVYFQIYFLNYFQNSYLISNFYFFSKHINFVIPFSNFLILLIYPPTLREQHFTFEVPPKTDFLSGSKSLFTTLSCLSHTHGIDYKQPPFVLKCDSLFYGLLSWFQNLMCMRLLFRGIVREQERVHYCTVSNTLKVSISNRFYNNISAA